MNILLICSAGMSTSIIVKKMQESASKQGIESTIWAVGDAQAKEQIAKADIILLGPQVRYMEAKTKEMAKGKPVMVMNMRSYGRMDGDTILAEALALIR